ncbi:hypothetical protein [Rufibacter quisquiliarum]|uniref:Uncharacterized protein n=1 Tax=Rufibacter quisquiliarum TaxID=1549639 RepID=A0A839GHV2_9BACT|nr:hypothetical protein [Rufibacter quisquiliarum]MBA9078190.1 hypothetical protein [Rufibacter quisquiliarum]
MKSLKDIQQQYFGKHIPYSILLSLEEWKAKRKEIIDRAKNTCEKCKEECIEGYMPTLVGSITVERPYIWEEVEREIEIKDFYSGEVIDTYTVPDVIISFQNDPLFAHVHHTYYLANRLPWEYPNESLLLVCHKCHLKIHQEESIPFYQDEKQSSFKNLTPCNRCDGTGHLPQYDHVENGICFRCNGNCFEEWID